MEYTAQWYQRATGGSQGVGSYDNMAISFAYADVVEVYDNTSTGNSLDDINPANTPRVWAKWYQGGQDCNVDADCPYAAGGAMAGAAAQQLTLTFDAQVIPEPATAVLLLTLSAAGLFARPRQRSQA